MQTERTGDRMEMEQNNKKEARENKKKRSIGGFLFNLIPVVALAAMLIFGGLFLRDYREYKAAEDEYSDLAEAYIQEDANADDLNGSVEAGDAADGKISTYPALKIDYDALFRTNEDFACVLYIPVLDLKYPVVYSSDNVDYLTTTFEKKRNFAGAIFYDSMSPHDFRAKNTFIFGHNMKNGSMFGKLKKLEKEEGLCASNPYIYIYTKDHVRKYRIFSFYKTIETSASYDDFDGDEGYDQYVKRCRTNSSFKIDEQDIDFTKRPQLLTLSTCIGRAGGNQRFLVHAALVGSIQNEA